MPLPSPGTKHTFLPLVAESHPHFDKALPPTTTNISVCTSTMKQSTSSSSPETQAHYRTPPSLNVEPVAQEVGQDPPHNDRLPTTNTGDEMHAWSVPHAVEHQKHALYASMLGMGAAKVKDEWGFSSASASRSHTPKPGDKQ